MSTTRNFRSTERRQLWYDYFKTTGKMRDPNLTNEMLQQMRSYFVESDDPTDEDLNNLWTSVLDNCRGNELNPDDLKKKDVQAWAVAMHNLGYYAKAYAMELGLIEG